MASAIFRKSLIFGRLLASPVPTCRCIVSKPWRPSSLCYSSLSRSRSSPRNRFNLRSLAGVPEMVVNRGSGIRLFATRPTTSSLNDPSPNWSNRPPKETILLDGCDFEHWLCVMEPPEGNPTRDEIIDSYIKTLAQVVGSEDEARKKIYSVSTRHYFAFGALVSEELSYKIKELPKVRWVLPDSYLDVRNKDYGGEPFIDGQAVPYDPKYHEEWVRNNARANERSRRNDRPRNFDRSRNFERRRENMQNRDFQSRDMPPMPNRDFQVSSDAQNPTTPAGQPGSMPNSNVQGGVSNNWQSSVPNNNFQGPPGAQHPSPPGQPGSMPNNNVQGGVPNNWQSSVPNNNFQGPPGAQNLTPPGRPGNMPNNNFQGGVPSNNWQGSAPNNNFQGGVPSNNWQGSAPNNNFQGNVPNNNFQGNFPNNNFQGNIPNNNPSGNVPYNTFQANVTPPNNNFQGNMGGGNFPNRDMANINVPNRDYQPRQTPSNDFQGGGYEGNNFPNTGYQGNNTPNRDGPPSPN